MRLVRPIITRPLYYLPYRLTLAQEDQIEDQIIDAERAIKDAKAQWADSKREKKSVLEELLEKKKAFDVVHEQEVKDLRQEQRRARELADEARVARAASLKLTEAAKVDSAPPVENGSHGDATMTGGEGIPAVDQVMDEDAAVGVAVSIKGAAAIVVETVEPVEDATPIGEDAVLTEMEVEPAMIGEEAIEY